MKLVRTTIMLEDILYKRVLEHLKEECPYSFNSSAERITDFTRRAFINQLENDGDFEIRDIMEEFEK